MFIFSRGTDKDAQFLDHAASDSNFESSIPQTDYPTRKQRSNTFDKATSRVEKEIQQPTEGGQSDEEQEFWEDLFKAGITANIWGKSVSNGKKEASRHTQDGAVPRKDSQKPYGEPLVRHMVRVQISPTPDLVTKKAWRYLSHKQQRDSSSEERTESEKERITSSLRNVGLTTTVSPSLLVKNTGWESI